MPERISPGTRLRLFADDSLLYRTIKQKQDVDILQRDLDNLQAWEKENSMEFHPQKCQVLKVTNKKNIVPSKYVIHNVTLEEVPKAKYLGVTINTKLTWKDHISNICRKANSTLGFLRRNLFDCRKELKAKCYKAYVRPTLEYSSTVWDPHHITEIKQIESIQKRAQRFIQQSSFSNKSDPCTTPQLETLKDRREKNKLIVFNKGLKNHIKLPLEGLRQNKRKPSKFMLLQSSVDCHLYSYLPSTLRLWNNLDSPTKAVSSLTTFKNCL